MNEKPWEKYQTQVNPTIPSVLRSPQQNIFEKKKKKVFVTLLNFTKKKIS